MWDSSSVCSYLFKHDGMSLNKIFRRAVAGSTYVSSSAASGLSLSICWVIVWKIVQCVRLLTWSRRVLVLHSFIFSFKIALWKQSQTHCPVVVFHITCMNFVQNSCFVDNQTGTVLHRNEKVLYKSCSERVEMKLNPSSTYKVHYRHHAVFFTHTSSARLCRADFSFCIIGTKTERTV